MALSVPVALAQSKGRPICGAAAGCCMRIARRLLAALVLALLAAPTALAHLDTDVGSGDEAFELAPQETRTFGFYVHYHRLVGRVDVSDGAAVQLAVYGEMEHQAFVAEQADEPVWRSGDITRDAGFNVLIDCCDGVSDSRFHLVVSNPSDTTAAHVRLAAKVAHDDLLVGTSGAEGDVFQNSVVLWIIGGFLAYRLARDARAPAALAQPGARAWQRHLMRSAAWAAAPIALALAAGAWGSARYGGGGVIAGMVATAAAMFPSFGGAFLVLAFVVASTMAIVEWLRAYRALRGASRGTRAPLMLLGAAEALLFAATPLFLVPEYGTRVLAVGPWMVLPFVAVLGGGVALAMTRPGIVLAAGADARALGGDEAGGR